jgi:Asp/Glu/hydantoin racemase
MTILILPPYQSKKSYVMKQTRELMENLEKKGQISNEEYVIDEGYSIDWHEERRDAEFLANISLGIIKRVKECARAGGVDAIVSLGSMEPAFLAAREISDIPYMGALHSGLHVASLLGDRCCVVEGTDPQAILARRHAKMFGLSHKLVSVRYVGYSSTQIGRFLYDYPKEERFRVPEVKACIRGIVDQCVAAVEQDRADSVILSCMPLQVFEDEVRTGFSEAGYDDVPLICETSAAVAMAKAVVDMRLTHARLAYPRADTELKPIR